MLKKATVLTYGCAMNVNESAKVKNILEKAGYEIIDDINNSDVVLLNTCTIREGAANKVWGRLGELKNIKKKNKNLIIGVIGCLAQEEKEEIVKKVRHVDIVMGNQNIHKIPEIIKKIENHEEKYIVLVDNENELPPRLDANFDSEFSATINIIYGCNNFCTYCIVPYVRGRERSVPLEEVLEEVKSYVDKGYKEITLLGQNVNSYGNDLQDGNSFAYLLERVSQIEGEFIIRFMSPHPRDFTDAVIDVIAKEDKISKHIHLPIQSGSTNILKKMNRGYSKDDYLALVEKMRSKIENVAFTTDIIVGFPGETEEDFLDTLDVVNKVSFENAYMFMYSIRSGTAAGKMENQVDDKIKNERLQRLISDQKFLSEKESNKYKDKKIKVLVEGPSAKNPEMFSGRTGTNKIVLFEGKKEDVGKFKEIKINETKTWTLYGEIV